MAAARFSAPCDCSVAAAAAVRAASPAWSAAVNFAARPPAGGPAATSDADPAVSLTLEQRGDALLFSWSLPPGTPSPALQVLLLRRGAEGVEAETRTVPLDGPRGTTTVHAPGLHAARAAAGWLDGERFVPLVRIS